MENTSSQRTFDRIVGCPESQITDSNDVLVDNPAYIFWEMVDAQLLSCITATISVSTLPLYYDWENKKQTGRKRIQRGM